MTFQAGSSTLNQIDPIEGLSRDLSHVLTDPPDSLAEEVVATTSGLSVFHGMISVFVVAFIVTLLATPLMRMLAVKFGVVDHPNDDRKVHRAPVAYLGGVAVFIGMISAIGFFFVAPSGPTISLIDEYPTVWDQRGVPFAVILGMMIIVMVGLFDDVAHISPRIKVAGQLIAAAALAMDNVGTRVAAALMQPFGSLIGNEALKWQITIPFELPFYGTQIPIDLIYWVGVAIIAIFVLGACNASNLIDGLDGLCTGITAIAAGALLLLALSLAAIDDGPLDTGRVVLALALLGATLGFLPHNFKPATIFLGDAGSLLLGYMTIVLVLSLGEKGKTHLVVAGLIIYAIPIIDTTLALLRRKLAGRSLSGADNQHLHHMLQRSLGTRGAVFAMYGMAFVFAGLGLLVSLGRVRVVMTIALVLASFIGVLAVKVARSQVLDEDAPARASKRRPALVREQPAHGQIRPGLDESPKSPEPKTV